MANDFGPGRTAGFSGQLNAKPIGLQTQRQHRGLGGFTRSLAALQGNEFASHARDLSAYSDHYISRMPFKLSKLLEFSTMASKAGAGFQQQYKRRGGNAHAPTRVQSLLTPARNTPIMSSVAPSMARCDMLPR